MTLKLQKSAAWALPITVGVYLLALFVFVQPAAAINQIPTPQPIPGSYGLAATKTQEPPTTAATITTPGNGASFGSSPITVSGICTTDLLVQVYNNGVMSGSVMCTNNSFSLQVSLFAGTNEFTAIMYDSLEQAGPTSNIVTVTYTDANISAFGQLITLTSSYGRRSAPTGSELTWPLQLTGGTGPYAFSLDWGDTSSAELKSQSLAGLVSIAHPYKKAGIYQVNVKATDVNGVSAFLQVVAVSSGKVDAAATSSANDAPATKTTVLWLPAAVAFILLIPSFWLGRLSEVVSLHNKMLKERDAYKEE
ncbi:MAG: hypothetical protein ACOH18_00370 [Candidatus Saccharimonadaceae bacterium]